MAVGIGVAVGVGIGVAVGTGVGVVVGVAVGDWVGTGVSVGVGTGVSVGSGGDVAVGTAVAVAVGVGGMLWQPVMTKMVDMARARTGKDLGNGKGGRVIGGGTPLRQEFGSCNGYPTLSH